MSTKISALTERLQSDINGEEFFPIIDVDTSTNNEFHTYKIKLDTLFASDLGYEKVTDLQLTVNDNTSFTLTYTKEDNTTDVITVPKYFLEDGHVAFSHINSAGYITSTQKISNNLLDTKLVTPKAVDQHHTYREEIYDAKIKAHYGDHTTDRSGSHVLSHFRLNSEVADDFIQLADNVSTELNTLGKIETKFNTIQPIIDSKIGVDQVNIKHFRVDSVNLSSRLNIRDSGIGSNLIAAGAVNNAKLATHSVSNKKLAPISISEDKIQDGAINTRTISDGSITPVKLSVGGPTWSISHFNTPSHATIGGNLTVNNTFIMKGHDFRMYNSSRAAGNVHSGRALVHYQYDTLHINYAGDFKGGTVINGKTTVPNNTQAAILAGGSDMVATKGYVDYADIRIRPLDPSRIQDDCIQLRHMSDDSVSTAEIVTGSITPSKLSNGSPSWNTEGDLHVPRDVNTRGRILRIGFRDDVHGTEGSGILLYPAKTRTSSRSSDRLATPTRFYRNQGEISQFEISNPGNIALKIHSKTKLSLSNNQAKIETPLVVKGSFTTIAGSNHSNPLLQLGDKETRCLSFDTNEIYTKGDHFYLGADTDRTLFLRSGVSSLALFSKEQTRLYKKLVLDQSIFKLTNDSNLVISGGSNETGGASIKLFGTGTGANAKLAEHYASRHNFKAYASAPSVLTIDTKTSFVTLTKNGTSPQHLVNKGYVDQVIFKPIIDRDDITSRINSGFYQTSSASKQNGWPETTNGWYHLLTTTHSNTSNYHALQFAAPYYNQEVYFRVTNNNGDMSWKKVWHSDNVGPGSGLNADLLDGKHANAFSLTSHNHDAVYRKKSVKITPSDLNDYAPSWNSKETILQGSVKVAPDSISNYYSNAVRSRLVVGNVLIDDPYHPMGGEKWRALGLGCGVNNTTTSLGPTSVVMFGPEYPDPLRGAFSVRGRKILFSTSSDGRYFTSSERFVIDENGLITAPNLTKAQISGNNKSLVTKEYVTEEISKVFPDDNYVLKSDDDFEYPITFSGHVDSLPYNTQIPKKTWFENENSVNVRLKANPNNGRSGLIFEAYRDDGSTSSDYAWIQYHSHRTRTGTSTTSDFYENSGELVIGVAPHTWLDNRTSFSRRDRDRADTIRFDIPEKNALRVSFPINGERSNVSYRVWHDGNDGPASGLDADKLDGYHANAFAFAGHNHNSSYAPISHSHTSLSDLPSTLWHAGNDGAGSGLDADKLDGIDGSLYARKGTRFNVLDPIAANDVATKKYVDATVPTAATTLAGKTITEIANNTTTKLAAPTSIAKGWRTIAVNSGNRAVARFGIRDTQSGRHQSIVFYASHHYGINTSNNITILHNSRFGSPVITALRIVDGHTYDGALLQAYVNESYNDLEVYMLGDNFQSGGWSLRNWLSESENPSLGSSDRRNHDENRRTYTGYYSTLNKSTLDSTTAWAVDSKTNVDADNFAEYASLDLGEVRLLKGMRTKGRADFGQWVTKYSIAYSTNGGIYNFVRDESGDIKLFDGNTNQTSTVYRHFDEPVEARWIRIYPREYSGWPSMRFDVLIDKWSFVTNEASKVDLKGLNGSLILTDDIYAGGHKEQHKVWHAGNDGSGSGLDADKLDGKHAGDFALKTHYHDGRYLRTNTTSKQIVKGLTRFEGSDTIATTIDNIDNKGCLSVKLGDQYMGIDPNEIAINTNILHITTDGVGDVQINRKKVWGDHNTENIIATSHVKNAAITHSKLSTGAPSWTTSGDVNVAGSLKIGPAGNNTRLSSTRVGSLDTLNIYSDDKIHFKLGSSNLVSLHNNGLVTIGTTSTVASQGKVHIDATAVPLSFRETDKTGEGSYWRMPLDGTSLRFDSSNDGVSFSDYTNVFQMYSNGRLRAPNLTIDKINGTGPKSLVTKEYVDNKVSSLGGGKIHYYTVPTSYTSSSAAISTDALNNAIAGLASVVSKGDVVIVKAMVTFNDYWWGGNSTGVRQMTDYTIGFYSVVSSTSWAKIARGVGIDPSTGSQGTRAYTQLRVTG